MNRQGRIAFGAVVGEHICRRAFMRRLADAADRVLSHLRKFPHNLVIGHGPLLGRFIGHLQWGRKWEHEERRDKAVQALVLVGQRGRVALTAVHMCNAVRLEHVAIPLSEKACSTNFNGVQKIRRES